MDGQQSTQSVKPKFTLHNSKLQVYAQNAIKKSNVKAFINQGIKTSQRLSLQNNQNQNLSHHLLNLKNSCNDLKRDITSKQNQAVKMRDETMYKSDKVKQIQTEKQILEEKIAQLNKDVQIVHMKKQSTFHGFKTYEHILERMKKDQINNQIRKNALQKQLTTMEKEAKQLENKLFSLNEYEELSYKGLKQAEQEIAKQSLKRQKKIEQISTVLDEKKISQFKKQQRNNQTKSIQQMAAGDLQDAELIRIKKFLQAQVFLKSLLKEKMQKLKNFYEPYELAFFKIKSQTSAKDANTLKSEFFNFESQYQEKTIWIKHLEEEIAGLENQRKELHQELVKAKDSQLDILEQFQDKATPKSEQDSDFLNNKQNICKRSTDCELSMMKINEWINYQTKLVSKADSTMKIQAGVTNQANFNKICTFLLQKCPNKIQKVEVKVEKTKQQTQQ